MSAPRFVVFDFDGVFSDGNFYFSDDIKPFKSYNAKDALAVKRLCDAGIKTGLISKDASTTLNNALHLLPRFDFVSLGEETSKLDTLQRWIFELGIKFEDVAYMGDDLADVEILCKVQYAACPSDAIDEVKRICSFVSTKCGGRGAVRQFVDDVCLQGSETLLEVTNAARNQSITAVIPVRKGSNRCKLKNIRPFGSSNILELKISALQKVSGIDEIIVSTDCPDMATLARNLGVGVHMREEYYASSRCPNNEFWVHLAGNVGDHPTLMMVNAVSPLLEEDSIQQFVGAYKSRQRNMVTVNQKKKFVCDSATKRGINFDNSMAPNSQDLRPLAEITFGLCIATREEIIETKSIFGANPDFFPLDDVAAMDLDTNTDFVVSELLFNQDIRSDSTCDEMLKRRLDGLQLLDCTIRDGGYLNDWNFSDSEVLSCYRAASRAGYDYFEIGFRTNQSALPGKGKWCYSSEDHIKMICESLPSGCAIAVMANVGTVNISDFIPRSKSSVSLVRVLAARYNSHKKSRYDDDVLRDARILCSKLLELGYEVCLNIDCADILDDDEIDAIVSTFKDVQLHSLYLVDTYGGFDSTSICVVLHKFYKCMAQHGISTRVGFHGHANNENALDKTSAAIRHGCNMIDSCIGGLGRGAGNLKSEDLLSLLYKHDTKAYISRVTPIIEHFDRHILSKQRYLELPTCMPHPYYKISGVLSLHPDYVSQIISDVGSEPSSDIQLMLKLSQHTREAMERNYNKTLINILDEGRGEPT